LEGKNLLSPHQYNIELLFVNLLFGDFLATFTNRAFFIPNFPEDANKISLASLGTIL